MDFASIALGIAYLVPWMFAVAREHERQDAILAGNLLLGWTGIGWLGLCAWAITSDAKPSRHRLPPTLTLLHGSGSALRRRVASERNMILLRTSR